MKNKSVTSNSRGFASWIEDFIAGLAAKEAKTKQAESVANDVEDNNKEQEVVAEINLNDLDKVVWKEETFRVHFDDKGANVINEFGNVVTTIPGAKTIEEVDKKLNGGEIVASNEDCDTDKVKEEIDKLAASLAEETKAEEKEEEVKEDDKEEVDEKEEKEVEDKKDSKEKDEDEETKDKEVKDEVKTASEEDEEDPVIAAIVSGFEELEAKVAALQKRLAIVEQQYARNPKLEDVSDKSPEEEVKHFTETADETAKEIEREHQVDLTSPAGRVELSTHNQGKSEVEQIVTEDTTTSNSEAHVDETPKDEEEVKDQVKDEAKTEEVKEDADNEDKKEEKEACNEDEEENTKVAEVEESNEEDDSPVVEKLSGVAEKIFKKGICPETGEELIRSRTVGNFVGVYSKAGTEYAVDLNTGAIYKYIKK